MKERKCKWCGEMFTPPPHRNGNPMKYCTSSCRAKAYNLNRRKARKRYNTKQKKTVIILCEWCGKPFTSTNNKKYCSILCRNEASREQNIKRQINYRLRRGKSDKQNYFENLGNSNLREHRKVDFDDEKRIVKAEKRRLHI